MKIKVLIIISLILFCSQCASEQGIQSSDTNLEIKKERSIDHSDIHNGLTGNFLFYISNINSDGDIWLYNIDLNSKWQITSEDNDEIRLLTISPFYRYIIYTIKPNENVVYDLKENETMEFDLYSVYNSMKYAFSEFHDINWDDDTSFYFIAYTNKMVTNIFKAKLNSDDKWSFELIDVRDVFPQEDFQSINSLSLSYDKKSLAFIAKNNKNNNHIYIYNLIEKTLKKLISVGKVCDLLWAENNKMIYYNDDNFIYSINYRGAKELVISTGKMIYKLNYHPAYKFKFFYISFLNDYFFINLKNVDYMGAGDFLCNTQNLKDFKPCGNSNLIFFDNDKNMVSYYNVKTTEIKKILDNASLSKLTP